MNAKALVTSTKFIVAATAAVSACGGAFVGFAVAHRKLEVKFLEQAEKDRLEAREYYQQLYSRPNLIEAEKPAEKEEDLVDITPVAQDEPLIDGVPVRMVQEAMEAQRRYSPESDELEEDEKPAQTVINVFTNHTPPSEAVLEALQADRDPTKPYIITKQEFYENDPEHEQRQFTYYEGDAVLVDDQEEYNPINDTDLVVGDENLLRFGYGSGDEHVLYVRNESVNPPMDLYITRSPGKYAVEVMNYDDGSPHLEHSQRRFRLHDE